MRTHSLRLVIAEPEPIQMALHTSTALKVCALLNESGKSWAELDIIPTQHGQLVSMKIGSIIDGVKQKHNEYWRFSLEGDSVHVTNTTIP